MTPAPLAAMQAEPTAYVDPSPLTRLEANPLTRLDGRHAPGTSHVRRLTGPFCHGVLAGLIVALALETSLGLVLALSIGLGAAVGLVFARCSARDRGLTRGTQRI